ncbi:MAG: class I SAM-dependent methyltransferase [Acidobacteriota bacterium]|nr:class I SAM-dependent methyltransferase [Acidobacteriota bacterium]
MQEPALLLEDVPCDLCGSTEVDVLRPAREGERSPSDLVRIFRASSDVPLVDRLVRCAECGLVFVSPRVQARTIVESYSAGEDPTFISQAEARERTFGTSVARIEALTGGPGRVFDIGTAGGAFLAAARARGWQVDGCEPNRWLANWGKTHYGIDIRPGPLTDHDLPDAFYDVVTLWDVVEHLPQPSAILERARALVKPGGFLILTFPDIGSPSARLLGRAWPFLSSVHLYYFSKITMRRMLRAHGFEMMHTRPHTQRLELGYVLHRAGDILGAPLRMLSTLANKAGAGRQHVPYRLGQTFVAARRLP